ncbi:MAG: LytTR family transcriptional regulator DNA-binding domain-containing protein [Oscillospiraceae bacterium]|nr:LytTR family transcriptional regulator DNA-binding domain-containing protein [Oscillospiraceae bacterium]
MKINIQIDESMKETEINISCKSLSKEVEQIISALRVLNKQLAGKKQGEVFLIDLEEIMYLESVDRKCFFYTDKDVFEADEKLYELEYSLSKEGFVRISKACLIQLKHISSIRSEIGQKLRVTMKNGEQIIVSRMYAIELKKRLGVNV